MPIIGFIMNFLLRYLEYTRKKIKDTLFNIHKQQKAALMARGTDGSSLLNRRSCGIKQAIFILKFATVLCKNKSHNMIDP